MPNDRDHRPPIASNRTATTDGSPEAEASQKISSTDEQGGKSGVPWSQQRRLQFIDFRLQWEGRLNRRDVTDFFSISVPQASADISRYAEMAPRNIVYDKSSRTYVASEEFSPVFDSTGPKQYLSQLLALERNILSIDQTPTAFRPPVASVPLPSRTIEARTLALMLRAIAERGSLEIRYQSIARDEEQLRRISPHAFGYDGVRWHVRAYCHLRNGFRDFVFGRILSAEQAGASTIDPADDHEWNTNIDILLEPHPSLTDAQRQGVEVDYGMKNGTVRITSRHAMLFYTLRTLNFESTGLPRKGERQLVIANLAELQPYLPKPGQK